MIPGGNPLLLSDDGYQIQRSLRLRAAATAYLNRTPVGGSAAQKAAFSVWVKPGAGVASTSYPLFAYVGRSGLSSNDVFQLIIFNNGASLYVREGGLVVQANGGSTISYRDPSAFYHFLFRIDTTQAASGDRCRLYVNGVLQPGTFSVFNLNQALQDLFSNTQYFGVNYGNGQYMDGLNAEFVVTDGVAPGPEEFGQIDPVTGQWTAKKYSGPYGLNGGYYDFRDPISASNLVLDRSGNGNHWTPNNISVTAGVTYDSMIDVPLGSGGAERGNYSVWNALFKDGNAGFSFQDGNLRQNGTVSPCGATAATLRPDSGKWYAEFTFNSQDYIQLGLVDGATAPMSGAQMTGSNKVVWEFSGTPTNYYLNSGTGTGTGPAVAASDTVMLAYDAATRKVWFGKNGVWNNSGAPAADTGQIGTVNGSDPLVLCVRAEGSGNWCAANFGQRPFTYTPPTGFKALHTGNLPVPTIPVPAKHFAAKLYVATAAALNVTGLLFEPGLVWIKNRTSGSFWHNIFDKVRGVLNRIASNSANAELAAANSLTAFNSDGFSLGTDSGAAGVNVSAADTYVAWCMKAGGAPASNTDGSITSQVSANPAAGFSIVKYTGNGSAGATIGHGLGLAPAFFMVKCLGSAQNWIGYHKEGNVSPANGYLILNSNAVWTGGASAWNNTAPSASVITLGNGGPPNSNGLDYVAYCFAETPGFSKIGKYTGNGNADGAFVHCGFRPAFVMAKRVDQAGDWQMLDASRSTDNVANELLVANGANAEAATSVLDIVSNGFKLRISTDPNVNAGTYVFLAIAEAPFKYANAR